VGLSITVIGTSDRQLEELLRGPEIRLRSLPASDLLALAQTGAQQPDVLVLDVRDTNVLPPTLVTLRRQHPTTGVVIVAARLDPMLMLEAMRAGISEWVANPVTAADLNAAIERVSSVHLTTALGQVFAFVGAKGGVGTTTTTVNVGAALARAARDERTLIVDLHLSYGDAAVFLGAEPRFSVIDALENTHRLDKAFFESLVVQTKSGAQLLASSERAAGAVDMRRATTLLQFAAANYRYTLLDVPRSDAAALDTLDGVSAVVIVANQELATVRNAGRMAAFFRQRFGKDRVRVVITRYDRLADIGSEDIERVVGSPVRHMIPSDYRLSLQALNKGRPLVLDGSNNKLADAFKAIAHDLGGISIERPADGHRNSGFLGRITGRR
jgi:pilus assembly protein CpaE